MSVVEIISIDFNGFQFFCEAILVWNLPISAVWASTLADRIEAHKRAVQKYKQDETAAHFDSEAGSNAGAHATYSSLLSTPAADKVQFSPKESTSHI